MPGWGRVWRAIAAPGFVGMNWLSTDCVPSLSSLDLSASVSPTHHPNRDLTSPCGFNQIPTSPHSLSPSRKKNFFSTRKMCDAFNFFTFWVKTILLSICFQEVGEGESCVWGGGKIVFLSGRFMSQQSNPRQRTFLVVQRLRLHASNAGDLG